MADANHGKSLKLAYLISPLLLLVFASILIGKRFLHGETMRPSLRVAFDISEKSIPKIDPADIQSISQGILIDNLYSRLVEYDGQGRIQAGVSSKFYWDHDNLIFEFTDKVKTKSGRTIGAEDAAISLRRLLKLGSNTHVNLGLFLCEIKTTEKVFEDCDSVRTSGNKLILTPTSPDFKPFLLQALTSIDFGIIPKDQIKKSDLSILSLEETSGPYYLAEKNENQWRLVSNTHYGIKKFSPLKVDLVSTSDKNAWDKLVDNEVDVISTVHNLNEETFEKIKSVPGLNVSKTLDIKLFFIKFSPRAIKDFTASQRLSMGKKFSAVMREKYPLPIDAKKTNQFFQDVGFGHLSKTQEGEITKLREEAVVQNLPRKISFYLYKSLLKTFSPFKEIPELDARETTTWAFMQKPEERLDLFMGTTDTAYEESLALLGYNFSQGTFGLNPQESESWMKRYMALNEQSERLKMIQDLHYETLKDGITVPLFKAPYTAVARNGFKVNLSPLFATTHFWDISNK